MRGLPLYSPATHLHGLCSLPNLRGYYIKKNIISESLPSRFHNPVGAFRGKADYKNEKKKINKCYFNDFYNRYGVRFSCIC